jgi:hypothetical protein
MTFTEKDFEKLRNFQKRVNREFGENAYVGADSATIVVNYSAELKAMLRPFPLQKHFEFYLRILDCRDCKKTEVFLCLDEQDAYVCDDCLVKRKKSGEQKKVE